MNHDKEDDVSGPPLAAPGESIGNDRCGSQQQPIAGSLDGEKYRWIRANRGNFAIVEALNGSDRDADFDERIEAEMRMCAAGKDSYRSGARRLA